MSFSKIAVLGMGNVGSLAATLLNEAGFSVVGIDSRALRTKFPFETQTHDIADTSLLAEVLRPFEAVLSCLPYYLNIDVARTAHEFGIHYFDLTEDVATTQAVLDLSKTATAVMAPQCGLAPGFVGIVGANLAEQFD
ncbi:MAG: saccharopine dehydrogenase NADP-binding domain-containing protein, partial [Sneathiella sp.]